MGREISAGYLFILCHYNSCDFTFDRKKINLQCNACFLRSKLYGPLYSQVPVNRTETLQAILYMLTYVIQSLISDKHSSIATEKII